MLSQNTYHCSYTVASMLQMMLLDTASMSTRKWVMMDLKAVTENGWAKKKMKQIKDLKFKYDDSFCQERMQCNDVSTCEDNQGLLVIFKYIIHHDIVYMYLMQHVYAG